MHTNFCDCVCAAYITGHMVCRLFIVYAYYENECSLISVIEIFNILQHSYVIDTVPVYVICYI